MRSNLQSYLLDREFVSGVGSSGSGLSMLFSRVYMGPFRVVNKRSLSCLEHLGIKKGLMKNP